MKVFICFVALAANTLGKDHTVTFYKSNDTADSCSSCRRIDFISTNNNRLQWSCIHPSTSSSSSLTSLILSSTTKQSPSMSLCKYDSNSVIYQKQQYHKHMEQKRKKSRPSSSSSSSSSSIQSPSKKVKLSIILDFDSIRNKMTGKSSNEDNNNNEYSVSCTKIISNDIDNNDINTMLVPLGQLFKAISFNTNSDIYINSNIDYGNDKDQLPAAILSDAITDTCASNHKNDTSLIYYNSNYNIEISTLEVLVTSLLSSVLVLVFVYVLGAVTVLVYQSIYTIRGSKDRNVDDQKLEKTSFEADGDTMMQAIDFVERGNSNSTFDMAAAVFETLMMEDYLGSIDCNSHLISSPVVAIETGQIKESMSPATKELSEYLESFSNIYNTNTTNNVYISNISNTNNYINTSVSSKIETPGKFTDRHHLIRCASNTSKKAISPTDLDDFYDLYDDDIENINPNINASTKANTSITYSIKPNNNPILKPKPKLKPKRPLQTSSLTPIKQLSPSSSVFHNIDKTMLSPKIQRQPAFVFHSTNSTSPIPSTTTSTVKSPFDATKDLCLSVSTNSVRVRSNIGKMMMDEQRYADANDIFDSVIETCKFLTQQNIDVENIITEVNIWKSEIVNIGNIVRIANDDDYE